MVKVEVIKKVRNQPCGACNIKANGDKRLRKNCIRCSGTSYIEDYHYTMIIGKNAFDVDTLK